MPIYSLNYIILLMLSDFILSSLLNKQIIKLLFNLVMILNILGKERMSSYNIFTKAEHMLLKTSCYMCEVTILNGHLHAVRRRSFYTTFHECIISNNFADSHDDLYLICNDIEYICIQ